MFKAVEKAANGIGKKVSKPFISPKLELRNENFVLNKYMQSIAPPKNREVHLLSYYYNEQSMNYQINKNSTKRLGKSEFDAKVALKKAQNLVIKKTQLNIKESNKIYICAMNIEEEKEEKINESS